MEGGGAEVNRRDYLAMLDSLEGQIAQAFLRAVADRVRRASLKEIEAGVVAHDVEAILRAAGLTSAELTQVTETIRAGYIAAAAAEGAAAGVIFDVRNDAAVRWLAEMSARLVVEITGKQEAALRIALEEGLRHGRGPRSVALDIVGRVGATGRRSGGIVGNHDLAAGWISNARGELLNLDPAYFVRKARDKRFDGTIRKAIKAGKPLPAKTLDAIIGRYADRLLKLRGDTIGRTEALTAVAAGREQAWAQGITEGLYKAGDITRKWDATMDARTRPAHAYMDGQRRAFGVPFQSLTGALLMHPGDSSLGAGGADTIQCRCYVAAKVDFIGMQARRERGKA